MKKLTEPELSAFCMEMSMLMSAGMPLEQAMLAMVEEEKTTEGKAMLQDILDEIELGSRLSESLQKTEAFPAYLTDMVTMGERTGNLEIVFKDLHQFYEEKIEMMHSVKSAVVYPFIMAIMMFVVLAVLVVKVLPMFTAVYYDLGSEVPALAKFIMRSGSTLTYLAAFIMLIVLICAVASLIYPKVKKGRKLFDLEKKLMADSNTGLLISKGRFASVLAMAFESGMDTEEAMQIALRFIDHEELKNKINHCIEETAVGRSLTESFEETGLFEGLQMGIFAMGERSGKTTEALQTIAERYTADAETHLAGVVSAIEPVMVIVLSVLVGIILLAVMLPLLGIMSALG